MHSQKFLFAALIMLGCCNSRKGNEEIVDTTRMAVTLRPEIPAPPVDTVETFTKTKWDLTRQYCLEHYGLNTARLDTPRIIVVHYTVIPTLGTTLALFKRDNISSDRTFIKDFSNLNVGIHYVIDKDGKIYNLLPDTMVARHLIGFNHVALGIENIAADSTDLTRAQANSNVNLIRFLSARHPTIRYLIGHSEYNNKKFPHFRFFKSLNPKYQPYDKTDPGLAFMNQIRDSLLSKHGLAFEK